MTETLYRLQMLAGPRAGQVVPLEGTRLTIGRYPLAEIVLDDPQVAYRHAVLTRSGGDTWRLADLNSDTGTAVNGRRVGAEPVDLQPGDLIVLGAGVSMTFEIDAPPVEEPVAETPVDLAASPDVALPDAAADKVGSTPDMMEAETAVGEPVAVELPPSPPPEIEPAHPASRGAPVYAAPPADPPRRKNRGLWWALAGCLALLFLCCCFFSFFMYFWGGDWLLRQLGYL